MLPKVPCGPPQGPVALLPVTLSFHMCAKLGKLCAMFAGTFGECSSEAEVQFWMRYNVFLLLEVGTFNALVDLLNMEIE